MIKASFSFTSDLVETGRFEIEFTSQKCGLSPAILLTFKIQNAQGRSASSVGTARMDDYPIWSEQPAALVLRALHLWRMTYFSSIPLALGYGLVRTLNVTIGHHYSDDDHGLELMTLSFIRSPELDGKSSLNQTKPGRAYWPMNVDAVEAAPFAVAGKVLTQVQHSQFTVHELPSNLSLPAHLDNEGNDYVLREDIPYYVLPVLDRFSRQYPQAESPIEAEHIVSAKRWNDFMTTI